MHLDIGYSLYGFWGSLIRVVVLSHSSSIETRNVSFGLLVSVIVVAWSRLLPYLLRGCLLVSSADLSSNTKASTSALNFPEPGWYQLPKTRQPPTPSHHRKIISVLPIT